MSPLYLHNGQLIAKGGALGIAQACCCSGECCSNYSNCTITITENFRSSPPNTAIYQSGQFINDTFLIGSFSIEGCVFSYSAADTGSTGENCFFTWNYSISRSIDCECCANSCSKNCSMGDIISEDSYYDETEGCDQEFGIDSIDVDIDCEACCCPDCVAPEGEIAECCDGTCKNTRDDTGLCTRADGSTFEATYSDCGRDDQSNSFTLCIPENPLP